MKKLDYPHLIDRLNYYDDDADYLLTKNQFALILKDLDISSDPNYVDITFNALHLEFSDTVPFNNIRALYENSKQGFLKNKAYMLILYCGSDSDKDSFLGLEDFSRLYKVLYPEATDSKVIQTFRTLDIDNKSKIPYHIIAQNLFNVRVRSKENPYKQSFNYVSPYVNCCLVA